MTEDLVKLTMGCLLHDIGKVAYRSGDGRNHSRSGYDYLKNEVGIEEEKVLHCILYHHGCNLKQAEVDGDDYAYLSYFADNIAAAADRREALEGEPGFDKIVPLASVFNILNGNHGKMHYKGQVLDGSHSINNPTEEPVMLTDTFYLQILRNVTEHLKGIRWTEEYMNSLLTILEGNLSYVPSSTSRKELTDISLYDHLKMTAAVGGCVKLYLDENRETNYRKCLFEESKKAYDTKMFLLYSMDITGIQNFIYSIGSKGALKGLRARSFYLEILMEHVIDELLEKVSLSRANLIYSGGGHCYLLLPNTEQVKMILEEQEKAVKQWLLEQFGTTLFLAGGYAACSANDLKNEPEGSYSSLYHQISGIIINKKSHRYEAEELIRLNRKSRKGERECEICHKMEQLNDRKICSLCAALEDMAGSILYEKFFTVMEGKSEKGLPLPGGKYLIAEKKEALMGHMKEEAYVRCYSKNEMYTGYHMTTKLWIGDYSTGVTFDEFAKEAEGIERIGILRADVDNLGTTFVSGFQRTNEKDRYVTLTRTATLSRQMSLFFKCYINQILEKGENDFLGTNGKRNITIVYSGGDDLFFVGSWNEIIEAFIDLKQKLETFCQNTVTISGGVGIYRSGYPINIMAKEVAALEDLSKSVPGKNAITLFDGNGTYSWDRFLNQVIGEKYRAIADYFESTNNHGNAFLYHLLELIQNTSEKINIARYVYLLSRMEPERSASKEQQKAYQLFSRKMFGWKDREEDRQELATAICLYVYRKREKGEEA